MCGIYFFSQTNWLVSDRIFRDRSLQSLFGSSPRLSFLSRLTNALEKRVSRNIRNIRGRIVGRHPVDYFENIITKRSASPLRTRGDRGEHRGERERRERRWKRDWKERAPRSSGEEERGEMFFPSQEHFAFPPFCILSRFCVSRRRRRVFHWSSKS